MRWEGHRESANVEDRRGMPAKGKMIGGGLGLILLLVGLFFGVDPRALLQLSSSGQSSPAPGNAPAGPPQDTLARFVSVVLADTEDVWNEQFRRIGKQYQEPKLVLFSDATQSACGFAQSATGPFYCPADQQVYIDLGFYREMRDKLGAPGDFAQAYVIAHEIGHHVQNLLGVSDQVMALRRQASSEAESNALSVRLELQADFLAGVWAHHAHRTRNILEQGDIEEALNAASAIGDDRLQSQSRGYITPDSFTHGTSAQRVEWFRRGLQSGDIREGDTFNSPNL
jgi:predicted metalloprotease